RDAHDPARSLRAGHTGHCQQPGGYAGHDTGWPDRVAISRWRRIGIASESRTMAGNRRGLPSTACRGSPADIRNALYATAQPGAAPTTLRYRSTTTRNMIKTSVIGILLLAGLPMAGCNPHSGHEHLDRTRPNIVLILADDLGYGDIGAYGQEKIHTPYIDRLAREGMRFTDFYAGTTVCAPSRSALLTGQHTGHTYIRGNKEVAPEGQEPLTDSVQTFAQLLQEAGYVTGAFGKWGLGMVGSSGEPNR